MKHLTIASYLPDGWYMVFGLVSGYLYSVFRSKDMDAAKYFAEVFGVAIAVGVVVLLVETYL